MSPRQTLAERLLDGSLLGYTKLGYRLRGLQPSSADLSGRRFLVTGATSGLGRAAALDLARCGATVVLLGRNQKRLERVQTETAAAGSPVNAVRADLSNLGEVRAAAKRLAEDSSGLDGVVLNAGVLEAQRGADGQGLSLAYRVNLLSQFILLSALQPKLQSARCGRAVLVSSGGMFTEKLDVDYLVTGGSGGYDGVRHYAQTKRAQVVLANHWSQVQGGGFRCFAMHPGWADTPGVERSLPRFHRWTRPLLRTSAEGADTIVWLATADVPEAHDCIWHDRKARSAWRLTSTRESDSERKRLWDTLAEHAQR